MESPRQTSPATYIVSLVLLATTGWSVSVACTCACLPVPRPAAAFKEAAVVFSGRVLRMRDEPPIEHGDTVIIGPGGVIVELEVFKTWKGAPSTQVVLNAGTPGCCGFPFRVGRKYLVYASASTDLSTNACGRTALLRKAGTDVQFLQSLVSSTTGTVH